MKANRFFVTKTPRVLSTMAALLLAFGLLLTGCANPGGGNGDGNGGGGLGLTWTVVPTTPFSNRELWFASILREIAYGDGTFIVGGACGRMARSSDKGRTWEEVTPRFFYKEQRGLV
jgi:hypothetical protein